MTLKHRYMILSISALSLIAGTSSQCLSRNDAQGSIDVSSRVALNNAEFRFAVDTLEKVAAMSTKNNVLFSPHVLYNSLTLAYLAASDSTETSLRKILSIPNSLSKPQVQQLHMLQSSHVKDVHQRRYAENNITYAAGDILWVSEAKNPRKCVFDLFPCRFAKMNLSNSDSVHDHVKLWLSDTTDGHIHKFRPKEIAKDTDFLLVDAVSFNGSWNNFFPPDRFLLTEFQVSKNRSVLTHFMMNSGRYKYVPSRELCAAVVEVPYTGKNVSMFLFQPNGLTVDEMIHRMSSVNGRKDLWDILNTQRVLQNVQFSLPRFELEKNLPVNELFEALGAADLLDGTARVNFNLSYLVALGEAAPRSGQIIHRVRLEVGNEGSTDPTTNKLNSIIEVLPDLLINYDMNVPFVYLIYDKIDRVILLSGVYRKPKPLSDEIVNDHKTKFD